MRFSFLIHVFLAALGLHSCRWTFSSYKWGYFGVAVRRLLIVVAPLVAEHRCWAHGLQYLQLVYSVLWCMGLVALHHVESSRAKDQTSDPFKCRRILNH